MTAWVDAIGIGAPGLANWAQAGSVLSGAQAYRAEPLPPPSTSLLAANERRRTTPVIRLALQTAEDALREARIAPAELCSVFACASGDLEIVDKICTALSMPERPVSPTQFHNSVHNAPAGYWSLGAATRMPSTSIAANEYSFAAGLLEAWTMVETETQPVLLVAYDWPPPAALFEHWPLLHPFAVALLLTPRPTAGASVGLDLHLERGGEASTMADAGLEALRCDNPAARSLPLAAVIASAAEGQVRLPYSATNLLSVRCHKR